MTQEEILQIKLNRLDKRAFEDFKALFLFMQHHGDTPWGYDTPLKTEWLIEIVRGELYGSNKR